MECGCASCLVSGCCLIGWLAGECVCLVVGGWHARSSCPARPLGSSTCQPHPPTAWPLASAVHPAPLNPAAPLKEPLPTTPLTHDDATLHQSHVSVQQDGHLGGRRFIGIDRVVRGHKLCILVLQVHLHRWRLGELKQCTGRWVAAAQWKRCARAAAAAGVLSTRR